MREEEAMKKRMKQVYGPVPVMFHERVEHTLEHLKKEEKRSVRKLHSGFAVAAALILLSAAAWAVGSSSIFHFITNTQAKTWVLDEAEHMLHRDAAQAVVGDCRMNLAEWITDGERLYTSIDVEDPALQTDGHYVPQNEEEDFMAGLEHYGLTHFAEEAGISSGCIELIGTDFEWTDETKKAIRYTQEWAISDMDEKFSVDLSVPCSEGTGQLSFEIKQQDFGRMETIAESQTIEKPEYTFTMTNVRASALHVYADAVLKFNEKVEPERREEIATDYQEGLLVPEGELKVIPGEGKEMAMPKNLQWSEDGLTANMTLEGNPRETWPEKIIFCPRWGMSTYDWKGEMPELSMDGALVLEVK